ncbi:peptidoglycan/xylan/chitin deacetylase (PgdA/CDA1 family) [Nocardiopsis sp. Huas11]|uniref:polysaccharide deacetylase family protein n=1 Tax=Nocardiopsis sp. Huas11 TaxID=2183912 RepID=UPI000EAD0ADB|nr:peptidoglycan/xylan/chitin deacetylase (PgdA/CDA1 family) [Nocardiopsis sp. Huas11]
MGLLLVPGCHAEDHALPFAEAIGTPVEEVPGVEAGSGSVVADHSVVGYRYPRLGGAHPLSTEIRTAMAERQTAFLEDLPERGTPELNQDTTILAISDEVVGARVTSVTKSGLRETRESSTLWYAAEDERVLPWTALFRDEAALEQAHLLIAGVLTEGYNLPPEQLPGLLGEVAARAEAEAGTDSDPAEGGTVSEPEASASPGASASPETPVEPEGTEPLDLGDPEQAWAAAEQWHGSPLADVAFSTSGGLVGRMDPDEVPGAGRESEVLLPVEAEDAEELLSDLGYQARDAALAGTDDVPPLGEGLSAEGSDLNCQELKCVALTFDDGPGEHTEELLDMLQEYDARATFYVLGSLVEEFPEVLERTAAEGHEIGNHSWKHDDLSGMSGGGVAKDLERTNRAVEEVIGSEPLTLRPPYGALNGTVRQSADMPIILWDVDTLDWESRDTAAITDHALTHSVPGSVVLFHDIHPTSVQAIPGVLEGLHRQGYHFVTVTDIFHGELEAGDVYTDAQPH